jgi:hypothetical protein
MILKPLWGETSGRLVNPIKAEPDEPIRQASGGGKMLKAQI